VFEWDGDVEPIPPGWSELSIEEWFLKFETLRERLRNIDQEHLPAVPEEEGLDREEVLLITQYGFRGGGHYERYRNWAVCHWAAQLGMSPTDCEFRYGTQARDRIRAASAQAMSAPGGALADVEGMSCAQWARVQAQIAGGAHAAAVIAAAGVAPDAWARISAEWNRRMSTDRSGTIAQTYANAFAGAAVGPYGQHARAAVGGDTSSEPVPFERFVEITEALRAGGEPTAVLATFGLRPVDWSNIGMFWNRKLTENPTYYHQLFNQLSPRFAAKYGNGDGLTTEEREQLIVDKLLAMARSGNAPQLVPFLQNYFPNEERSALDWWLDKACDSCARTGERATAHYLLVARYPLQDGVQVPIQEWVSDEMSMLFT
jgi:hypothetical protein